MPPSQQTWPWRKSGSTSVPRKKPPTWRLAPSPLPSPSQRRPCHPAPAAALTAPRPRRSPQKPQSSCRCQKSVPGRNPPPRPWPCPIRAAGIQSSNCPAFSPGTPVHSQNESGAVPLVNPPRPVDEWRMPAAQHIPQFPPSASWSEGDFSLSSWFQPLQQTRRRYSKTRPLPGCLYRYKQAARSPQLKVLPGVKV